MKLTILGSGSPEAYIRRASSGYLVEAGKDKILFDCGGGVFENLLRYRLRPSDITHLVFSHLHSDHMMDYARLVHAAWDEGAAPLQVYGPAPIAEITDKFFGEEGIFSLDLRARTEFHAPEQVWTEHGVNMPRPWPKPEVTEITSGDTIQTANWKIDTCAAHHAKPILECLGFALTHKDQKFVYSGDAALAEGLEHIAQDADLLLYWCYRLDGDPAYPMMEDRTPTPTQIGEMAQKVRAKRLILTHFRKAMDAAAGPEVAARAAKKVFDHPVMVAEDLMSFNI